MAKQLFVFCNGPHAGPCPNRVIRLLREIAGQGVTFSSGCSVDDVYRRLVELGRVRDELGCEARDGGDCPYGADKPHFDHELGELWARGMYLHCFGAQACNEVAILNAFRLAHWSRKVFDALGEGESKKYGASLKETVCRLNKCQRLWLIEFHSHPKARAVSWKWRLP